LASANVATSTNYDARGLTEGVVASHRLYDGLTVVADGSTQLATAPNGQVLTETTTTTTTKGKTTTTSVAAVDVLTDVLGSTVATASDGVISADLALFGDFGVPLTTPKRDTVSGFTGKIETAGLVEFAARTYDPSSRVWVQDDRYRGTTTRAASMNRYAYVEGAPESFVDVLGFYRARAAVRAQKVAALQAAFQSALDELNRIVASQARLPGAWTVAQMMASYNQFHASDDPVVRAAMDKIARQAFYGVTDYKYQQKIQIALAEKAAREAAAERNRKLAAIDAQYRADQERIQAEAGSTWLYDSAQWVGEHKAEIVGGIVGLAGGLACTALTAGVGAIACFAGAGALAGAVTGGMSYVDEVPADQRTWGGFFKTVGTQAAIGAVIGGATAGLGMGLGAAGKAIAARFPEAALVRGTQATLGWVESGAAAIKSGVSRMVAPVTTTIKTGVNKITTNLKTRLGQAWEGTLVDDAGSIQIGGRIVPPGGAANSEAEARALLASIGEDGRTAGVLNIDGELTPLVSGADSLPNYAASGHVEGQAALIMREQGVSYAELLIDNPNGICSRCVSQVPTLLPGGAELTVTTPFGTVPKPYWFNSRTIVGNASDPKSWPR